MRAEPLREEPDTAPVSAQGEAAQRPGGPEQKKTPAPVIRLLLADDHCVVRQETGAILEQQPDLVVVAEAESGEQAVALARQHQPEVVVMDVSMPGTGGIEATRQLHEQMPQVRIIGLSMYDDPAIADSMREAGAAEYLPKGGPAEDLVAGVRGVDTRCA